MTCRRPVRLFQAAVHGARLLAAVCFAAVWFAAGVTGKAWGADSVPVGAKLTNAKPPEVTAAGKAAGTASKPVAPQPVAPLRFRRAYVPTDRAEDWPLGTGKYLPMDADKFEEMLREVQQDAAGEPPVNQTRLVTASYQGRLSDGALLAGEANLEIAHAAKSPAMLPFDPCNLAIRDARWNEAESGRPTLGTADNGKLQLLVERPGRLQFHWLLAGRRESAGRLAFPIEIPACPVSRFDLVLPAKLKPVLDRGLVLGGSPAGEGLRGWQLELGGHRRFRLHLTEATATENDAQLALVRQSLTCDFSPQGVEVSARLKLEAYRGPLTEVALALDAPLQLVSARLGDTPVPWSVGPPENGIIRAVLVLPEPLRDGTAILRVKAVAPLLAGRPWKLPRIMPQGLFWQEGNITLLVPHPLVIEQIEPVGCRQSAFDPLSATLAGESAQFECLSPEATVQLSLAMRRAAVQDLSGTLTEMGNGKMNSRVVADFRTTDDAHFLLQAELTPQWTIDTVQSLPADALEDWTLEPGNPRKLAVRLAQPLTAARPIRLLISARRLYVSPGRHLAVDDVVPLRFTHTNGGKRLVALRALGPYELKLTGDERCRPVPVTSLTAAEVDLFGGSPGEILVQDDGAARNLRVSLEERKPSYTAVIGIEAAVSGETLRESYLFDCAPSKGAKIERLLVRFSQRRAAAPRWSLDGKEDEQPSARQWSAEQQSTAGLLPGQETWELSFRRSQDAPLKLRAVRETKLDGPTPVSLACLPEAAAQQGELVIRGDSARPLVIENRRLKSEAPKPVAEGQYQTARAVCVYDPARDVAADSEPAIVLSLSAAAATPDAWVWDCEVQSYYVADGTGQHLATYRLQNSGGERLRLALPPGAAWEDIHGVWLDGSPVALMHPTGEDQAAVAIDLPPGEKLPMVAIHFSTHGSPMHATGRLLPPLPEADLPVLARHWTVWLPPGYEASQFAAGNTDVGKVGALPHATPSWATADLPGLQPQDTVGWHVYRLAISDANSGGLDFVHRSTLRAWGWAMFLLVSAVGTWKLAARPALLMVAAGLLGIAVLWIPMPYTGVVLGMLLGTLLCLAVNLIRRARAFQQAPLAREEPAEAPSTTATLVPFVPVLMVAIFLSATSARGAETTETDYRVLIPVDDRQQPAGGKYYVPEAFYDQLHRRAAARVEKPQGWLITAANYQGALARDATAQDWVVEQLTANFELRVFGAPARVRIPLHAEGAKTLPDEILLDRQPVQPEWAADGSAMFVDVAEPGVYSLSVALHPTLNRSDGATGFALRIPRLAASRLELLVQKIPFGGPAIEIPDAVGAVRTENAPPRLVADLGPIDRLAVRWQDDTTEKEDAPALDVEQLLWLKVRPGCVVLDAKLRLKVAAGHVRRLRLAADPGLQLVPPSGPDAPIYQVLKPAKGPPIIEFQWARPIPKQTELNVRFLAKAAAGVGTVRLPRLEVVDAIPIRRWLAVSLDPGLDYQIQAGHRLDGIAPAEFVNTWGPGEAFSTKPSLAYRLPSGPVQWTAATRPRGTDTAADQTLDLLFDSTEVELGYHGHLVATGEPVFQHRLALPPDLRVEQVSMNVEGKDRPVRWSREQDGTITVFLAGPVSGRHQLSLRGRLPVPRDGKMPMPLVQIASISPQPITVRLFRQPAVLVALSGGAGLTDLKPSSSNEAATAPKPETAALPGTSGDPMLKDSIRDAGARLVRQFSADPAAIHRATLTITPNRPQVSAEQITRLFWEEGTWKAAVECRLHVADPAKTGFWDALFAPSGRKEPGGVLDRICLDVRSAWNGPYHLSVPMEIKSSEVNGEGRRLTLRPATEISGDFAFTISGPLDLSPSDRVASPDILVKNLQEVKHLKRYLVLPKQVQGQPITWETENLREAKLPDALAVEGTTTYEVLGDSAVALLQLAAAPPAEPRLRLADIRIAWQSDGSCRGTAALDVEIGKLSRCPLRLPDGCRLVQAAASGVPLDPVPTDDGWLLPLVSEAPLQRIEVVFTADCETLAGLFSRETRRCFRAPTLGDLPVERTIWTIAGPSSAGRGTAEEAESLDPASPIAVPDAGEALPPAEWSARWQTMLDRSCKITRYSVAGPSDSLTLRYTVTKPFKLPVKLGMTLVLASLSVAAVILARRRTSTATSTSANMPVPE